MIAQHSISPFARQLLLAFALTTTGCENGPPPPEAEPGASGSGSDEPAASELPAPPETRVPPMASAARSSEADAAVHACPSAGAAAGSCRDRVPGVYAVEVVLDVVWVDGATPETPRFDPGRGELRLVQRLRVAAPCADGSAQITSRVCGLHLPPLYADQVSGVMQLGLPDAIWDHPEMPAARSVTQAERLDPGAALQLARLRSTLGIDLGAEGEWPAWQDTPFLTCADGREGSDCFPDHDGDGAPGVSLNLQLAGDTDKPGWHFAPIPTDPAQLFLGNGAGTVYAGVQAEVDLALSLDGDCELGVSSAHVGDVQLRALDCTLLNGQRCSAAAATFVDQAMPTFHALAAGETPGADFHHPRAKLDVDLDRSPSSGPRASIERLGDDPDCTDARAAFGDEDESH
jgi:hypothetical protein